MKTFKKLIVLGICSIIIQNCFAQNGPSTHSVYRATSSDGLNFIKDTTLLFFPASVPGAVMDTNETIFLYYVYATQSTTEVLNFATSTDGANFTSPQPINLTGSSVIKRVDPNPVLLPDGRIRLYYIDLDPQPPKDVHSAISSDGINFTEEAGIRFTKNNITDPDVFMLTDSSWVMFVSKGTTLVRATSSDGLTFTEDPTFIWNNGAVCSTFLFPGGIFRTYYCGGGIKSATSTDGYNLSVESGIRIQPGANESVCDPTMVHLGSTYIMYYKSAPTTSGFGENNNCCGNPDISIYQNSNSIVFQFSNLQQKSYTLKIYDATGKLVYTSDKISVGTLSIEKNIFQNGVYIYDFFNEQNIISTGRFIIE
jgi:hypothetical protein